jgi:hypothetical protein
MISDPQKLLDAMQQASDAAHSASVTSIIEAHLAGMEIMPSELVRRPTLVVPPHIFQAVKERLQNNTEVRC